LPRHGRHGRVRDRARRAHPAGAQGVATHDHRPRPAYRPRTDLIRRGIMSRKFESDGIKRRMRDAGLGKGEVGNVERRLFLRTGLSFGALTLLSGCDVVTNTGPVDGFLRAISRFNDGVQAALFNPQRLAPTFPESMVPAQFRFNAQYGIDRIPNL